MKIYLSDDGSAVAVFIDDKMEPEWYTVDEFVGAYGEELLPECKARNQSNVNYWHSAIEIIKIWIKFQRRRKLYANAICDETRHRVWSVIVDYYCGDIKCLESNLRFLKVEFDKKCDVFWHYCRAHGVYGVGWAWFKLCLRDNNSAQKLRSTCEKSKRCGAEPVSLQELI